MQENKPPLNLNKLASLEVTLVRNYNPLSYSLKGVRSRATNVAKNSLKLSEYGKGTFFYFTHITTCILAEGPYVFWPKAPDLT